MFLAEPETGLEPRHSCGRCTRRSHLSTKYRGSVRHGELRQVEGEVQEGEARGRQEVVGQAVRVVPGPVFPRLQGQGSHL